MKVILLLIWKKINTISERLSEQTYSDHISLSKEYYNAFLSLKEIRKDESIFSKKY